MNLVDIHKLKDNEFVLEELECYKLTVTIDDKNLITTSNNEEHMKNLYDEIIRDNINDTRHIVVAVYDYNKDTNIYYYDSDEERC